MKSSILSGLELFPKKKTLFSNESSTPTPTPKTTTQPPQRTSSVMASAAVTPNNTNSPQLSIPTGTLPLRKDEQFRQFVDDQFGQKGIRATKHSGERSNDTLKGSVTPKTIPSKLDVFNAVVAAMADDKKGRSSSDRSNNDAGRSIPSDKKATETNSQPRSDNPRQGIPEEYSELADILDQLPNDFDLTKWDDKTASQQHNALTKSGLSDQDQMKLLNASTSIETLAMIQEIQRNRIGYGLTQTKADSISEGLLKIANARIGVKNRGLPFTSDLQRNLFLKQLDKEEQKLLESVDGQKSSGHDMLFNDDLWFKPDQLDSRKPPKIITEVDNDSKLASMAKSILKAFVGIQYIIPADLAIMSMEALCDKIDQGTIGVGVSLTGVWLGGLTGNTGLVMDTDGDVGIIYTGGGYAGSPSLSLVGFATISNADDIISLKGESFEAGGSAGEVVSLGGEIGMFTEKNSGRTKFAVNLNVGVGLTPPILPLEGHAGITTSEVEELFNLFDEWKLFLEDFIAW